MRPGRWSRLGAAAALLAGCSGGVEWHWPVLHLATGLVVGLAIGYGAFRVFQSDLRQDRRADREEDAQPKQ